MLTSSIFFSSTNFYLTASVVWSLSYFVYLLYSLLIFVGILYLISNINDFLNYYKYSNLSNFSTLSGLNIMTLLMTPIFLLLLLDFSWSGSEVLAWFSHILFSSFQYKVTYLIIIFYAFIWVVYGSVFYYTSQEVYDFTIVLYSFFVWMILFFTTGNTFTLMFMIELLSTLIMLLLITSVFSSTYFYNNLDLNSALYFHSLTPTALIQTLLFFFLSLTCRITKLVCFLDVIVLKLFNFWLIFDWSNIYLYYNFT